MLYVFSDRAAAGWDSEEAKRIKIPDGVQVAYIDFGVDQPRDLDIEKIEVNPLVVAPGGDRHRHRRPSRGRGGLRCQSPMSDRQ